jgi:hypothetical protein
MSIGNQSYNFIDFQAILDPLCLIPDSHIIIIALEPKLMLGLKQFVSLLKTGEEYPILRMVRQQ